MVNCFPDFSISYPLLNLYVFFFPHRLGLLAVVLGEGDPGEGRGGDENPENGVRVGREAVWGSLFVDARSCKRKS